MFHSVTDPSGLYASGILWTLIQVLSSPVLETETSVRGRLGNFHFQEKRQFPENDSRFRLKFAARIIFTHTARGNLSKDLLSAIKL